MVRVDVSPKNELLKRRYFHYIIRMLVHTIDSGDVYTRGHSEKVMKYCAKMAKAMRLDKTDAMMIKIGALFHDIGKFTVDRNILNKADKLTEEEWRDVRKHSTIGAKIVEATGLADEIVDIVRSHHEHYSGGGYPDPIRKGDEIPLGARMILVADAYDAMVSKRPYRSRALTKEEAAAELKRCSGTQFDPYIVSVFIPIIKTLL